MHANYAELGAKPNWGNGPVTPVFEDYVSNSHFLVAGKSVFVWIGVEFQLPAGFTGDARIGYVAVTDNRAFMYLEYSTRQLADASMTYEGLAPGRTNG